MIPNDSIGRRCSRLVSFKSCQDRLPLRQNEYTCCTRVPGMRRIRSQSFLVFALGKHDIERRVVVTGQAVVCSLGQNVEQFYHSLLEGRSAVSLVQKFDTTNFSTKIAAELENMDVDGYIEKDTLRQLDPVVAYITVSGKKALQDAGLQQDSKTFQDLEKLRCGILIGTAMGGMPNIASEDMTHSCTPLASNNIGGAYLAMELGFMGPNYSISTACATGNYCILSAAGHIKNGEADLMLAGGADAAVTPFGLAGGIACQALSSHNDEPERASRPWDKHRDGFVPADGAGVLVLESLEHATERGAHILAELVGGACTCDAHHITVPDPSGKGVIMCIQRALEKTGIEPEEVNYVNAHATSTPAGDLVEYRAIRTAIPHKNLRINATKSMTGHTLGAAGALEAIVSVQAIRTGLLHPSINITEPEEEVDMDLIVANEKQALEIDVALSNSFGFGGHNSCILLKSFTH